jgi:phosphoribosylformimino-5-aminoimidazole carboxamide ribotide isomerase
VAQGASIIHLVDLDGAQRGRPVNLEAIGAVARAVATPLQVAGGIDGPEQIELAFAAGATRVVVPLWAVVEDAERLAACLRIAGDWLAVGVDGRPESLRRYPWRHRGEATLAELTAELLAAGVRRILVSHLAPAADGGVGARATIEAIRSQSGTQVLVAGGVERLADLEILRDAGADGVIVGEVLFSGAIGLTEAIASVG